MIQHHHNHLQVQHQLPSFHHHQDQFSNQNPRQYPDQYNSGVSLLPHLWPGPNDPGKNDTFPNIPYNHSNFCHGDPCSWNPRPDSNRILEPDKPLEKAVYNPHYQPNIGYNSYLSYPSGYSLSPAIPHHSNQVPVDHFPPTPFPEDLSPPPSNNSSPRSSHLETHHGQEGEGLLFDTSSYNDSQGAPSDQKPSENHVSSFGHENEDVFYNGNTIYNEISCNEILGAVNGNPDLDFCTNQIQGTPSSDQVIHDTQLSKSIPTHKETSIISNANEGRRGHGTSKRRHSTSKSKPYSTSATARQTEEMLTSLRQSINGQCQNVEEDWPTNTSQRTNDLESQPPTAKMVKLRFASRDENQIENTESLRSIFPSSGESQEAETFPVSIPSYSSCRRPGCKKHHRKRRCKCKRRWKGLAQKMGIEDFVNTIQHQLKEFLVKRPSEPLMLSEVFQVNQEESLTVNLLMVKTSMKSDNEGLKCFENDKSKTILGESTSSKHPTLGLGGLTKFKCHGCGKSFALTTSQDVESICNHIASGFMGPSLTSFSAFYQSCKFRVKLVVKPIRTVDTLDMEVTAETMVACTKCNKSSFELDHQGLTDLGQHLDHCQNNGSNFCIFCDRHVSSLKSHFDGFRELHLKRVKSLSICFCTDKLSELQSRPLPFVQCSLCKSTVTHSEPKLAHWMTSTTCVSCISTVTRGDHKDSKPGVIFCRFCQQGQVGFHVKSPTGQKSDSSSICVKCLKILRAFEELRNGRGCNAYVQGMLNELRGKLSVSHSKDQKEHQSTDKFPPNGSNLKKVAIVNPEPRCLKEKDDEMPSESVHTILMGSNPKLNIDKCSKIESNVGQKSFIKLCHDFCRGVSPLLCKMECLECLKVWNLNRKNAKEVHSHLFSQKLGQNSEFFDKVNFIVTCKDRAFPTSTSICFISGTKCKNCNKFCGNFFKEDFVSHLNQCFSEKSPGQDQNVKEIKLCQG